MSTPTPQHVVLVHGIHDTGHIFKRLQGLLTKHNFKTHAITLQPGDGSVSIKTSAQQLADFINRNIPPNAPISLIGFSLGGMVGRYYLQRLNGLARTKKFITIASPHHGTWTAYLIRNAVGQELRPNSQFLQDLNRDKYQLKPITKTIGTPFDLMIIPSASTKLFQTQHHYLPVPLHSLMLIHKPTLQEILKFLA